uniref:Pyruvate kinase n=1 Tax=uncultured archaeon Rifle_16ft_4_minimus_37913 TaxID=1665152 RepID=A0A0H4T6D5_9ARCH|nr:sulfate adenylyltransferase, sulfate adenylyltransferase [uncultured archaeon Rifle_16ft_4_minimus_37913]
MRIAKIICTIGPGSNSQEVLGKLKERGVDYFRINLSHTKEEDIENRIKDLLGYGVPIILDTEGCQVRSGNTEEIFFEEEATVKIHDNNINCNQENLFLNPAGIAKELREGDLVSIDFNSLLLRVFDVSTLDKGYVLCKVIIKGKIGGNKAVQIDSPSFSLPPFSKKDYAAVELAKKYKLLHFTLSFMESSEQVVKFKKLYPEAVVYSKIESKKGLDNFLEIAKASDGILIDRGDLSNQVAFEKIPFIQKFILREVADMGKEAFIATNTLEHMAFELKPSKAEVNDIVNTILDGATGIALTKETAVGQHPIETVNTLISIMNQFEFLNKSKKAGVIDKIEETNYLFLDSTPTLLIEPHGGRLVERFDSSWKDIPKKTIEINEQDLMDLEQIATGAFSPLEGFMEKKDFYSVVENMRLSNGLVWPIPIVLSVNEQTKQDLKEGENIGLSLNQEVYGILHLSEMYRVDKEEAAKKIFGTADLHHPGVIQFMKNKDWFLGGKITLLKKRSSAYKIHELTPKQARKIFSERGWKRVVGFHTRNVIHRGHEFIQLESLKRNFCDGLFLHPVIGKKKEGDFETDVVISSYEKMVKEFYPNSKVVFGTLTAYPRYGGPREAVFTALIRKNFGCSHFIVGRDHTGVGNFYQVKASHEIFDKFSKEELGIEIIKFDEVFYSDLEKRYFHNSEFIDYPEEFKKFISGTQAREMLKNGVRPPEWLMRPEISDLIIRKIKNGERVFVEVKNKILWFTGLSGSGKTTIADKLKQKLEERGKKIKIIDGDEIRSGVHKHLDFSPEDIKKNNKLISDICLMEKEDYDFILVPIISPFKDSRLEARKILGESFIEVYVKCSMDECTKRDTKGLYAGALAGEIENFIGVAKENPYEPPENPEIIIETERESVEECVGKIIKYLGLF